MNRSSGDWEHGEWLDCERAARPRQTGGTSAAGWQCCDAGMRRQSKMEWSNVTLACCCGRATLPTAVAAVERLTDLLLLSTAAQHQHGSRRDGRATASTPAAASAMALTSVWASSRWTETAEVGVPGLNWQPALVQPHSSALSLLSRSPSSNRGSLVDRKSRRGSIESCNQQIRKSIKSGNHKYVFVQV
ncbi:hypothetical protein LZ30DRAFT_54834 [Colletotrichum cereale]|nr:hypothetical protein LZ30DRAFT_54834 [Colletotrichum cereale]